MYDFVSQHRSQLGLAAQFSQQPSVDGNFASGHGPGVRHRVIDDSELVRQVSVADRGELVANLLNIGLYLGVSDVVSALTLARRHIVLPTGFQFPAFRD